MNSIAVREPQEEINGREPTIENCQKEPGFALESGKGRRKRPGEATNEGGGDKTLRKERRGKRVMGQGKKLNCMGKEKVKWRVTIVRREIASGEKVSGERDKIGMGG